VESFAAPFEHVPLESVVEATAAARRGNADLVVTLGGGSVIDAGKALRTCLAVDIATTQELGSFMERPPSLVRTPISAA
jgi:maleylacetate reductase